MKKLIIIYAIFLCGTLYANDYRWDFISALSNNNLQQAERILVENIGTMQPAEKNLIMNFAINFSWGENAVRALELLEKFNILPGSFDLYTALNRNQPDIVIQTILDKGAQPNGEILLLAMERQRFYFAMQIIQAGVNVNYQYPLSSSYADGMTPLLYAAKWNNFDLVRMLVENGAVINVRDIFGASALSIARTNGNNQIYDFLLNNGAVETPHVNETPSGNTGISGFLESQASAFQPGTYRHFGGNIDMRFSGSGNSGSISYTRSGIVNSGYYRIEGRNLLLIMDGRTFTYTIDSNMSFSGNGEVWVRTGN